MFLKRRFIIYLLKFFLFFCLLYYSTTAIIGLSAPGGYYSSFVANYLNYVAALRYVLLHGSKFFLLMIGYKTIVTNNHILQLVNGHGVRIVYSCLGYGVLSFWGAFVLANHGSFLQKLKWLAGGWLIIYLINVGRISLLLISINKKWPMPFNLNHHTLFSIAAYTAIFILIYCFDRSSKRTQALTQQKNILPER